MNSYAYKAKDQEELIAVMSALARMHRIFAYDSFEEWEKAIDLDLTRYVGINASGQASTWYNHHAPEEVSLPELLARASGYKKPVEHPEIRIKTWDEGPESKGRTVKFDHRGEWVHISNFIVTFKDIKEIYDHMTKLQGRKTPEKGKLTVTAADLKPGSVVRLHQKLDIPRTDIVEVGAIYDSPNTFALAVPPYSIIQASSIKEILHK